MANLHPAFLSPEDVREVALPLLRQRLGRFAFDDVSVREEEDFDGENVLRLTADVAVKVPAKALIDVTADIHSALRRQGDERYVYVSTRRPGSEKQGDEDVED